MWLPYFSAYDFLHKTINTVRYTRTHVIRNFIYTHKISLNF